MLINVLKRMCSFVKSRRVRWWLLGVIFATIAASITYIVWHNKISISADYLTEDYHDYAIVETDPTHSVRMWIASPQTTYNVGDRIYLTIMVESSQFKLTCASGNILFDPKILKFYDIAVNDPIPGTRCDGSCGKFIITDHNVFNDAQCQNDVSSSPYFIMGYLFDAQQPGQTTLTGDNGSFMTTEAPFTLDHIRVPIEPLTLTINEKANTKEESPATSAPQTSTPTTSTTPTSASTTQPSPSPTVSPTTSIAPKVTIDPASSSVFFDRLDGIADGQDRLCFRIAVKNSDGSVNSGSKPNLNTDNPATISDLTFSNGTWSGCLTSTHAGITVVQPSVDGVKLASKNIVLKEPVANSASNTVIPIPRPLVSNIAITRYPDRQNQIFEGDHFSIAGTAEPHTHLKIYIHSDLIAKETTANQDGHWEVVVDSPLPAGSHTVEVAMKDATGRESTPQPVATFSIDHDIAPSIRLIVLVIAGIGALLATVVSITIWRKRRVPAIVTPEQWQVMTKSDITTDSASPNAATGEQHDKT